MPEAQFYVGVHGVIANRGRILVLKRAERMPYKPGHWDLPGGHLGVGESFDECLLREIREETGLDVSIERLLGINKSPGEAYVQAVYGCRLVVNRLIALRADEHVESRWATVDEIARMELIPYLDAALHRGLLDYVRTRGG